MRLLPSDILNLVALRIYHVICLDKVYLILLLKEMTKIAVFGHKGGLYPFSFKDLLMN